MGTNNLQGDKGPGLRGTRVGQSGFGAPSWAWTWSEDQLCSCAANPTLNALDVEDSLSLSQVNFFFLLFFFFLFLKLNLLKIASVKDCGFSIKWKIAIFILYLVWRLSVKYVDQNCPWKHPKLFFLMIWCWAILNFALRNQLLWCYVHFCF